jgi:hypothetical protein
LIRQNLQLFFCKKISLKGILNKCLQARVSIFNVIALIFLHLHGLDYVSCQIFYSFYEKGLIYMILIQFIMIQN